MATSAPELPPPDNEEPAFQQSCADWAKSLIERHDHDGMLGLLPYDPDRYPLQRMDEVFLESYQPDWDEVMEHGTTGAQNRLISRAAELCSEVIGQENYFELVNSIADKPIAGRRGDALVIMRERMRSPNQDMAVMMLHSKIISMPILLAARASAFNGSVATSNYRQVGLASSRPKPRFDLFEYSRQNFTFVNSAIARIGLRQATGELVSVLDEISPFTNIVKIVPPTTSSKDVGISKGARRAINDKAVELFAAHIYNLRAQNKSAILTIDPTGSTADHVYEGDRLVRLEHKRVNPLAAQLIQREFKFVYPSILWWDKGPGSVEWYLGAPESLRAEDESKPATRAFNSLVEELAAAEDRLSGAQITFGKNQNSLGQLAVETAA